jgi:hypothetical protein
MINNDSFLTHEYDGDGIVLKEYFLGDEVAPRFILHTVLKRFCKQLNLKPFSCFQVINQEVGVDNRSAADQDGSCENNPLEPRIQRGHPQYRYFAGRHETK